MRILAVCRLSRSDSTSTSIARQRDGIESWAAAHGHSVLAVVVDEDVSGDLAPWRRPGLGPFLPTALGNRDAEAHELATSVAQSRAGEYDALAVWHLDRLSRRTVDTLTVARWLRESGKHLFDVQSGADYSDPAMGMVVAAMASLAEGERARAVDRAKAAQATLRAQGRYRGGAVPAGYLVVSRDGGRYLDVDPAQQAALREAADRILGGEALNGICRDFNERDLPTSGGGKWAVGNLQRALTSDRVLGYEVRERWEEDEHGKRRRIYSTTLDDDGSPKRRADPVLPEALVVQVRKVLSERRVGGRQAGARSRGALLLGILLCSNDQHERPEQMWQQHSSRGLKYYRCRSAHAIAGDQPCGSPGIRMPEIDALAESWVLAMLGDTVLTRRVWDAGVTHSEEIDGLKSRLAMLGDDRDAGLFDSPTGQEDYRRRHARLSARIDGLLAAPQRPPRWVEIPTGETFRDAWERSDVVRRNALLRQTGMQFWTFGGIGKVAPVWTDPDGDEATALQPLPPSIETESSEHGELVTEEEAMTMLDRLRQAAGSKVRLALQESPEREDEDPEWTETLVWLYAGDE